MIIFTGTGRSGTKLYSKLFDAHHEFNVEGLKQFLADKSEVSDPFENGRERLAIARRHLQGVDLGSFRDSSNPYIHFLDALYEIDREVKICLGVRDGRDFAISGITRGYHDNKKYPFFGMMPAKGDSCHEKWATMTPLERNAWIWTYRNQKALKRLESVPEDNKIIIKLEALQSPGKLEELERFVGMRARRKWLKQKVNANRHLRYPPKQEWTEEMNNRFYRIAGEMMDRFGYPVPSDPDFLDKSRENVPVGQPSFFCRALSRVCKT